MNMNIITKLILRNLLNNYSIVYNNVFIVRDSSELYYFLS